MIVLVTMLFMAIKNIVSFEVAVIVGISVLISKNVLDKINDEP